jgi:transposase
VDEFGPIELKPELGQNWSLQGKPDRVPATYSRTQGVQHLFTALDLTSNKIYAHIKPRKRWKEFLQFLKYLRSLYPPEEVLYIVLDNFSPHKKEEVMNWINSNNIKLYFTPTNASWLNRIECHYTPIKKFALQNSNYKTKKEQARAIRRYIAWRNANKNHPKIKELEKRNNIG